MKRPAVEVADILRAQGSRFLDRYRSSLSYQQIKAIRAIQNCRTAALGGHIDACPRCGHQAISYNSCRNRHCPKCQAQARQRWVAEREQELLDTSYFHVVFTVPHELNVLALENPRLFYDLLFTASAQTVLEVAAEPKHLGAQIGLISILHTWGQNLLPSCVSPPCYDGCTAKTGWSLRVSRQSLPYQARLSLCRRPLTPTPDVSLDISDPRSAFSTPFRSASSAFLRAKAALNPHKRPPHTPAASF